MTSLAPVRFGRSGVMPAGAQRSMTLRRSLSRCSENLGDQAGYIECAVAGRRACVNSKLGLNGQSKLPPAHFERAWRSGRWGSAFTSHRVERARKVGSARRGFAVLATSAFASPPPVETPVCKVGWRSFAPGPVAPPSLAPRFARGRQPRPDYDRADAGWRNRGDWVLLQRPSRVPSDRKAKRTLIIRILKYGREAIDLGRMLHGYGYRGVKHACSRCPHPAMGQGLGSRLGQGLLRVAVRRSAPPSHSAWVDAWASPKAVPRGRNHASGGRGPCE